MRARSRGAGISIVIIGIVVLTMTVLLRQHRQGGGVPSTPPPVHHLPRSVDHRNAQTNRPRPSSRRTDVQSPYRNGFHRRSRHASCRTRRRRPAFATAQRVADQERVATPPPIAPALPEEPPEAKKPIEAIEPDAPRTSPVPAPEPREVSPPDRVFEKESLALAQVLGHYEQAYDRLDANGAAAIWPSVDSRALARAFARLQVQDLDFDDLTFAVSANDATARCAGVLHYARRIGDTTPKTEQHVWTIEFARAGEAWRIVRVTAR